MNGIKGHFLLKVVFAVSFLLLTRCLSAGIAFNRSTFEGNSSTRAATSQLPKTVVKLLPTLSSYPTIPFNKTWNCSKINLQTHKERISNTSVHVYYTDYDPYVCHLNPLHCKRPKHMKRLQAVENKKALAELPKYGDYKYLPISRWIPLLQHGAVAFLYHPCTSKENIENLRKIARKCMWKHIITPYEHLNITQPIAMVAWASFYSDWRVNESAGEDWVKNNAMKAPASHVILDGGYTFNLRYPSEMVSDALDTELCPDPKKPVQKTKVEDLDILNEHYKTLYNNGGSSKKLKKHLIQKIKHGLRPEKRTMNTGNAAWAVASLLFLCLVLVLVLVYTKPWNERDYYLKEKMACRHKNSSFNLLRLSRNGRTWNQISEEQRNAAASRRLLGPINEEDEDFMDL